MDPEPLLFVSASFTLPSIDYLIFCVSLLPESRYCSPTAARLFFRDQQTFIQSPSSSCRSSRAETRLCNQSSEENTYVDSRKKKSHFIDTAVQKDKIQTVVLLSGSFQQPEQQIENRCNSSQVVTTDWFNIRIISVVVIRYNAISQ